MKSRVVLSLLLLVTLAAFSMATISEVNRQSFAKCQARYNEVISQRTRALTGVAEEERAAERAASDALGALFLDPSVGKPSADRTVEDRERVRELYAAYVKAERAKLAARAVADRARSANPVPPPPSELCG